MWAKPVPVNVAVMTRREIFNVAFAGSAGNILLMVVLALAFLAEAIYWD